MRRSSVAGATGVIGRPLIGLLVADGHEDAGMMRSSERADVVAAAGAAPVVCDVFDAAALGDAVVRFGPHVVIDELTDLPDDVADIHGSAAANARIRRDGNASNFSPRRRQLDVGRFLVQSVAWRLSGEAAAVAEMEPMVLDAGGVVLRYGQFYGPGTYSEQALPPRPVYRHRRGRGSDRQRCRCLPEDRHGDRGSTLKGVRRRRRRRIFDATSPAPMPAACSVIRERVLLGQPFRRSSRSAAPGSRPWLR